MTETSLSGTWGNNNLKDMLNVDELIPNITYTYAVAARSVRDLNHGLARAVLLVSQIEGVVVYGSHVLPTAIAQTHNYGAVDTFYTGYITFAKRLDEHNHAGDSHND